MPAWREALADGGVIELLADFELRNAVPIV